MHAIGGGYSTTGPVARPSAPIDDNATERAIRVLAAYDSGLSPEEITESLNGAGFPAEVESAISDETRRLELTDTLDVLRSALESA